MADPLGAWFEGAHRYAWAWVGTAGADHHLLIRKHLVSGEMAYHYCFVPPGRPVTLMTLVRVACLRWPVEVLFRLVKVDLRTAGGVQRSGTPVLVRQELWALLCLYQALRTLITRTAVIAGVDPTRISFLPALDAVKASVGRAFSPS